MERCPVCRARVTSPVCRRCGSDFTLPLSIAEQADERAREALSLCRQGYLDAAMQLLQKSLRLKREAQLERLLDVLIHIQLQTSVRYLAQGRTQEVSSLCQRILNIKAVPLAQALQGFVGKHSVSSLPPRRQHAGGNLNSDDSPGA